MYKYVTKLESTNVDTIFDGLHFFPFALGFLPHFYYFFLEISEIKPPFSFHSYSLLPARFPLPQFGGPCLECFTFYHITVGYQFTF